MIDVFEYMRLADDGCPWTPAHVPTRPDPNEVTFGYDEGGLVLMDLPIHHRDFVLTVEMIRFDLKHHAEIIRGTPQQR